MQLTALKKLLHRISQKISRAPQKSWAEISESKAVSDMTGEEYGYTETGALEVADASNAENEAVAAEKEEDKYFRNTAANELINSDLSILKESFSELSGISGITELPNPTRYAALRDLGLTPEEAYLATAKRSVKESRSHLTSSVPRGVSMPKGVMTKQEMQEARALFGDMDDNEIHKLYKRVTN